MQIINKKISSLIHPDYNPRQISEKQFEQLKTSLKSFNAVEPAVVNIHSGRENIIIGGNQRIRAAQALGWIEFPCVEIDLEEERERELNIRLNANTGSWDWDLLANNFDNIKLEEWGFEDLPCNIEPIEGENDVPQVKDNICKSGDLWQLGEHRLLCGDSTKKEDVEKLMNGNKADMIFTDPPYGVDYSNKNKFLNNLDKGNRIQKDIKNDTMTENETNEFWYNYFNLIKNYLNDVHSYYIFSPQIQGMMMMMMKAGMPYRHVLIWVKNNHVLGRTDYNYKHEPMLYGWTKDATHKFYGKGEQQFSVWNYDKPHKSDLHPTMKPIELIVNAILNSSTINNIIIDSFLGSGSTLIACEKTNRICYGVEIDEHHCDVIIKRWEDFTGKKAVKII
jgi:DNA modification methylase